MNRFLPAVIVAVVTAFVVFTAQDLWYHSHPPVAPRTAKEIQKPLAGQAGDDAQAAARDFFTAMKDSDWTAVEKFWPKGQRMNKKFDDVFTDQTKSVIAGLEIVSIGAPYQQGHWTMVPYEVQFKGGGSQTNSLRMMKQPDGQWVWGGGF